MAMELDVGRTQVVVETAPPKPAGGITIAPTKLATDITIAPMGPAAMPIFAPPEPITCAFQSEDPPLMVALVTGQMAALRKKRNAPSEDEDDNFDAVPHKTYIERQSDDMHKLPRRTFECTVCMGMFRKHEIIQLECKHLYCPARLKNTFIHISSDVAFFPPRCCKKVEIPVSLISDNMSTQEMEDYTDTRIEIQTEKQTYCSHNQCGTLYLRPILTQIMHVAPDVVQSLVGTARPSDFLGRVCRTWLCNPRWLLQQPRVGDDAMLVQPWWNFIKDATT